MLTSRWLCTKEGETGYGVTCQLPGAGPAAAAAINKFDQNLHGFFTIIIKGKIFYYNKTLLFWNAECSNCSCSCVRGLTLLILVVQRILDTVKYIMSKKLQGASSSDLTSKARSFPARRSGSKEETSQNQPASRTESKPDKNIDQRKSEPMPEPVVVYLAPPILASIFV